METGKSSVDKDKGSFALWFYLDADATFPQTLFSHYLEALGFRVDTSVVIQIAANDAIRGKCRKPRSDNKPY